MDEGCFNRTHWPSAVLRCSLRARQSSRDAISAGSAISRQSCAEEQKQTIGVVNSVRMCCCVDINSTYFHDA